MMPRPTVAARTWPNGCDNGSLLVAEIEVERVPLADGIEEGA